MKKIITQQVYDAVGNKLAPINPGVIHPQFGLVDHSKTRFFREDGSEMLFSVDTVMSELYGNVYQWAICHKDISARVAFTMFGKFSWLTKYKYKPKAVTAMHKLIIERAIQDGFITQLTIDGWL